MNRNQIEGSLKDFVGSVQQKAGRLIGNTRQQENGTAKQVEGKVQKGVGDVEQTLHKEARMARLTRQRSRRMRDALR